MDIEFGAEVVDKNGKVLGTIDYIVRDTYSGDIKNFKVSTELVETGLYYSPEDVLESTATRVKLKTAFEKQEGN